MEEEGSARDRPKEREREGVRKREGERERDGGGALRKTKVVFW